MTQNNRPPENVAQAVPPVEITTSANVALHKLRCYNGIMTKLSIQHLSDEQLLDDLQTTATLERGATAQLIALLAEMDARQLYLAQGYSSLFTYCTRCLRLSEHAAYGRIEAARATRRYPLILDWLTDGSLTLTSVCRRVRREAVLWRVAPA
jgi:hypothetical protein